MTSRELTTRLNEVKTLLSQDIDPSKESSVLGKVLKELKNLLDAKRQDSVQAVFTAALEKATAENGTLAKTVKAVVAESVKPLALEVDRLAKEIRGRDAAHEALQNTTVKGFEYEDEVVMNLQNWSKLMGVEVNFVGADNKPGDILIKISSQFGVPDFTIVIEARDRESQPWGRKRIGEQLTKAMSLRGANGAIFLSRYSDGFAREIGEWGEGVCQHGTWIATIHENFKVAIRMLIVQQRFKEQVTFEPKIDTMAVSKSLQRIRDTLKRIASINQNLTIIDKSAKAIQTNAESLRQEIRDALDSIEDAIRE